MEKWQLGVGHTTTRSCLAL